MNLKRYGKRWSWPNSRYCPRIYLEGLRKIKNKLRQNGQSEAKI
jgi:hypothetical protein